MGPRGQVVTKPRGCGYTCLPCPADDRAKSSSRFSPPEHSLPLLLDESGLAPNKLTCMVKRRANRPSAGARQRRRFILERHGQVHLAFLHQTASSSTSFHPTSGPKATRFKSGGGLTGTSTSKILDYWNSCTRLGSLHPSWTPT
jgi:hypothetical protein